MSNIIGWGQGATNNSIGWGQSGKNNIGFGSIYAQSYAGDTDLRINPFVDLANEYKIRVEQDGGVLFTSITLIRENLSQITSI